VEERRMNLKDRIMKEMHGKRVGRRG